MLTPQFLNFTRTHTQDKLLEYPQLYGVGREDKTYSRSKFWPAMLNAVWCSLAIFFVAYLAYRCVCVCRLCVVSARVCVRSLAILFVDYLAYRCLHLGVCARAWNYLHMLPVWASASACVCFLYARVRKRMCVCG